MGTPKVTSYGDAKEGGVMRFNQPTSKNVLKGIREVQKMSEDSQNM
jgi:hypothetical protein